MKLMPMSVSYIGYSNIRLMISYFCTVGKGLERFCILELSKIKELEIHEFLIGKVFFSCNAPPDILLALKTVERLFISVFHGKIFLGSDNSSLALSKLKAVFESNLDWHLSLSYWHLFQKLKHCVVDVESVAKLYGRESHIACGSCVQTFCVSDTGNYHGDGNISNKLVRFRVSCKCSGYIRNYFHQQKLARVIGSFLVKTQGWTVDLQNPDVEIYVHAGDEYLTIGLPVAKRPLSARSYLKHIKVRSTLCHAILMAVGGFDSSSIVLDPMCGAATLLVEGAVTFPSAVFVGLDIDSAQLKRAKENVDVAAVNGRVHLVYGDATNIPLSDGCVSHVVCDLPFGNKFGSVNGVKRLLPQVLHSLDRVLRVGGKLTFLISDTLTHFLSNSIHNLNTSLLANKNTGCVAEGVHLCHWKTLEYYSVKLGELPANICVFEKASVELE